MQSLELEGSVRAQGSGKRTETKAEALSAVLWSLLFNIWIEQGSAVQWVSRCRRIAMPPTMLPRSLLLPFPWRLTDLTAVPPIHAG